MVGDVGDEEDEFVAVKHRRDEGDIRQVRAATDERIVGNKHVAGTQILWPDPFELDPRLIETFPLRLALRYSVLPVAQEGATLVADCLTKVLPLSHLNTLVTQLNLERV